MFYEKKNRQKPKKRQVIMMKVLSFGEVLWDIFGDKKTLGGAPLNFSAHLSRLGADVTFVSAVGDDALGKETLAAVEATGLRTDAIAVLEGTRTGFCAVTLENGTPHYDLARGVAYDRIPYPALPETRPDALYLGTLASREAPSHATASRLLAESGAKEVFFDVNIRGNDWSEALIAEYLAHTTLLKLSREELYAFSSFGKDGETVCKAVCKAFPNMTQVILTLDKDGAMVYDAGAGAFLRSPVPKNKPVSTVGAGDSFSACYLYNYLAGEPTALCLARAVALSDFVVTQLGAVPDYPDTLWEKIR